MNGPPGGKGGGGLNLGADLGFTPPPTGVAFGRRNVRLPPEVNRILYVRNMPYKISADELYDIFGKYGSIRQIRRGNGPETRGTCFVVYDDIYPAKMQAKVDARSKREEIDRLKRKYNVE